MRAYYFAFVKRSCGRLIPHLFQLKCRSVPSATRKCILLRRWLLSAKIGTGLAWDVKNAIRLWVLVVMPSTRVSRIAISHATLLCLAQEVLATVEQSHINTDFTTHYKWESLCCLLYPHTPSSRLSKRRTKRARESFAKGLEREILTFWTLADPAQSTRALP